MKSDNLDAYLRPGNKAAVVNVWIDWLQKSELVTPGCVYVWAGSRKGSYYCKVATPPEGSVGEQVGCPTRKDPATSLLVGRSNETQILSSGYARWVRRQNIPFDAVPQGWRALRVGEIREVGDIQVSTGSYIIPVGENSEFLGTPLPAAFEWPRLAAMCGWLRRLPHSTEPLVVPMARSFEISEMQQPELLDPKSDCSDCRGTGSVVSDCCHCGDLVTSHSVGDDHSPVPVEEPCDCVFPPAAAGDGGAERVASSCRDHSAGARSSPSSPKDPYAAHAQSLTRRLTYDIDDVLKFRADRNELICRGCGAVFSMDDTMVGDPRDKGPGAPLLDFTIRHGPCVGLAVRRIESPLFGGSWITNVPSFTHPRRPLVGPVEVQNQWSIDPGDDLNRPLIVPKRKAHGEAEVRIQNQGSCDPADELFGE